MFLSWINEDSAEHPFEEFLVAAGQYKALAYYAAELECHRKSQSEVSLLGCTTSVHRGVVNVELLLDLLTRNFLQLCIKFIHSKSRRSVMPLNDHFDCTVEACSIFQFQNIGTY